MGMEIGAVQVPGMDIGAVQSSAAVATQISGNLTLFIHGYVSLNDNLNLFINGFATQIDNIDLYCGQKLSCADIALKDCRSESTIYKILLKNKVQMRNKSEANQIFDDCLLKFMYNLGLSLSQIAEVLGIDATTISKRFTLIDFPTRIPCQAKGVRYTKEEFKRFFMNNKFKELIQGG
jgi:DNA-binding CsgD family transcriptional regulator